MILKILKIMFKKVHGCHRVLIKSINKGVTFILTFQVGRALLDMVNSVPKMTSDQFEEMFNNNVKDLLMVISLSQLIKTQLQLNEKLTLLTTL